MVSPTLRFPILMFCRASCRRSALRKCSQLSALEKWRTLLIQTFSNSKYWEYCNQTFLLLRNGAHTLLNFTRYQIKHGFATSISLNLNILLLNEGNTFSVFSLLYMTQNWDKYGFFGLRNELDRNQFLLGNDNGLFRISLKFSISNTSSGVQSCGSIEPV